MNTASIVERIAAMPSGHEAGALKRAVALVCKRYGWTNLAIFKSRDSSGFNIYAGKDVEQLADIVVGGGRDNSDLNRELAQEAKKLEFDLKNKLRPQPLEIVVRAEVRRAQYPSDKNSGSLYIYLKYGEGHYVTPLEFL